MTTPDTTRPTALEWLDRDLDRPELVVQGVPTAAAGTAGSDAWQAPDALRGLLARYTTFDGENGVDLEQLRASDWGDWLLAHLDIEEAHDIIATSSGALPTRPVYVFLGGDNSITYPLLANLPHVPLERFGLLTFDSQHDVEPNGDLPDNHGHVRRLVEAGLDPQRIVQIGSHGFVNSLPSRAWCEERGVRIATRRMIAEHGIERVVDEALAYLAPDVDAVYVDCDLAVLDRSDAPGCPDSRPGGLSAVELGSAMLRCGAHPKVVAIDLVEVDPVADVADTTVMSLARAFLSFAAGVAMRDASTPGA